MVRLDFVHYALNDARDSDYIAKTRSFRRIQSQDYLITRTHLYPKDMVPPKG
jgi:hypothetical protein